MTVLSLSREQILRFRRTTGGLDQRVRPGRRSLRRAAWAGLQDSMPRAASLAINARVERTGPEVWEDPALVQIWGPRFSVHVVPRRDLATFTLGRLPAEPRALARAEDLAARLHHHLAGRTLPFGEAGRALGGHPNQLRYAAATGTVLLRWDGAAQPTGRPSRGPTSTRPTPGVNWSGGTSTSTARRPPRPSPPGPASTGAAPRPPSTGSADPWSRCTPRSATPGSCGRTPISPATIAGPTSSPTTRSACCPAATPTGCSTAMTGPCSSPIPSDGPPSGPPRVWPGAILAGGEIVGTWRRSGRRVTASPWKRLPAATRRAVEAEAAALPLPDPGETTVEWVGP